MTVKDREHALHEHLALISTEAYLLLWSADEAERINRYNMVQEQISVILRLINDKKSSENSCPDIMLQ